MLEVTGIYKKFRNRQILKGVSFQAEPGMCVGIAGGKRMRKDDASLHTGRCEQAGCGKHPV